MPVKLVDKSNEGNIEIKKDVEFLTPLLNMTLLSGELQNWAISNIGRFPLSVLNHSNIHKYEATWSYISKQINK